MIFLAVDDEKLQLNHLVDALKEADNTAEIYSFQNPLEALEKAKEISVDVAFLDIEMPGLNGVDLAKKLKGINPLINIIFCTGYSEYAFDAMKMHASGYLGKPITKEMVQLELSDLRFPMHKEEQTKALLRVQCFGNFEVFYKDIPVKFARSKTKELFAYLVDRNGAMSTSKELSAVLFKENKQPYLRILVADLNKSLKAVGAGEVFVTSFNGYAVNTKLVECDFYDYLNNEPYAVKAYRGQYMKQYKWAKFNA